MGTSAFEILIVPVFLAALGSSIAGAAILSLMNAIEALAVRVTRGVRFFKAVSRAGCERRRRIHRLIARGVGSIG
jgi:hypothetical protein